MISTKFQKTAQMPSFGMSAYGQTSVRGTAVGGAAVSTCARVRLIGDMGLATIDGFPGTSAWRPPSC